MLNSIEIFFPYIRKFTDTTCHNSEFCLKFNNLNLLSIVYRFKKYKYLELISKIKEQKKILQIFYIKSKKKNFKILNLLKSCKILLLKNIQKLIFLNNNIIKSIFFLNKNPKLFLDKTIKTRIRHYEDEVNLFKFHHKFRLFCENNFNFYDTFLIFMNRYFNINLFFIYKFEKFK